MINLRLLFEMQLELAERYDIGDTPAGRREVIVVAGGRFRGERLAGDVLSTGGSDLLLMRADDSFQQDARLLLRTRDGVLIVMTYRGVRVGTHLRTTPYFETGDERYAWLNQIATVASGRRNGTSVEYEVFEVL